MVLYADTIVIPDAILLWVESARLRKKGTELCSCLGGGRGSRLAEMPRQGRVVVPNWPHHVIQRGHNTQGVFRCDDDYAYYWQTLEEWKTTLACQV
jgi:putative transposase